MWRGFAAEPGSPSAELEVITVTAQKRSETEQTVIQLTGTAPPSSVRRAT